MAPWEILQEWRYTSKRVLISTEEVKQFTSLSDKGDGRMQNVCKLY